MITRRLPDEAATRALGEALGRVASAGDVLALTGTLGAGKTTLTQALARGLEVVAAQYVNSPTFAILQIHPGRATLYHIDLYRIEDPDEALGLGLEEVVGTDGVAVIEWPQRLPDLLPPDTLHLELIPDGEAREVRAFGVGARAERLLAVIEALP